MSANYGIVQVRQQDAGDFLPQGVLRRSIAEIERAGPFEFSHDEDDLDGFQAAVFQVQTEHRPSWVATAGGSGAHAMDFMATPTPLPQHAAEHSPLVFMLQRYDRESQDSVTVFLPKRIRSEQDIGAALHQVLRALGLDGRTLVWQRADGPAL